MAKLVLNARDLVHSRNSVGLISKLHKDTRCSVMYEIVLKPDRAKLAPVGWIHKYKSVCRNMVHKVVMNL